MTASRMAPPSPSIICSHSIPRASGSSAASLAHSSALPFPGTPLCAGHHRISAVMSGLALRVVAVCLLAWSAYIHTSSTRHANRRAHQRKLYAGVNKPKKTPHAFSAMHNVFHIDELDIYRVHSGMYVLDRSSIHIIRYVSTGSMRYNHSQRITRDGD